MPDLPPDLFRFAASLAAVLALAWLARRLGLGAEARVADETALRGELAGLFPGFEPVAVALDREGRGGLARDAAGRVALVRPHGAHCAGRLLPPGTHAHADGDTLTVDPGERRFGPVRLALDDAADWAARIGQADGHA